MRYNTKIEKEYAYIPERKGAVKQMLMTDLIAKKRDGHDPERIPGGTLEKASRKERVRRYPVESPETGMRKEKSRQESILPVFLCSYIYQRAVGRTVHTSPESLWKNSVHLPGRTMKAPSSFTAEP